jgi:hypothetical protein
LQLRVLPGPALSVQLGVTVLGGVAVGCLRSAAFLILAVRHPSQVQLMVTSVKLLV